jgi:SAM-dependent methyltransferase
MPRGTALDLPCGAGRNALYLAESGFRVDAIDVSQSALDIGEAEADRRGVQVRWHQADLDTEDPPSVSYDLIVSCFYVNRTLIPRLKTWVTGNGFVVFEQHLATDLQVQGPHKNSWRMAPGELLELFSDFQIVYYEEGVFSRPNDDGGESDKANALARLVACKGSPGF